MAPKGKGAKGGYAGGGGGGHTSSISLADVVAGGNAFAGLANASTPSAMPSMPGAQTNDVMQTMLLMQAMGSATGGKTNVSMSPLEMMQFRSAMQQQQQRQQFAEQQQQQVAITTAVSTAVAAAMEQYGVAPRLKPDRKPDETDAEAVGEDDDTKSNSSTKSGRQRRNKAQKLAHAEEEAAEQKRRAEAAEAQLAYIGRHAKEGYTSDGDKPSAKATREVKRLLASAKEFAKKSTPERVRQETREEGAVAGAKAARKMLGEAAEDEEEGEDSPHTAEVVDTPPSTKSRGRTKKKLSFKDAIALERQLATPKPYKIPKSQSQYAEAILKSLSDGLSHCEKIQPQAKVRPSVKGMLDPYASQIAAVVQQADRKGDKLIWRTKLTEGVGNTHGIHIKRREQLHDYVVRMLYQFVLNEVDIDEDAVLCTLVDT